MSRKTIDFPKKLGPCLTKWAYDRLGISYDEPVEDPDTVRVAEQPDADTPDRYLEKLVSGQNEVVRFAVNSRVEKHLQVVSGHIWGDPASRGPRPADVMVIGKCLGYDEAARQRLFVGASGSLLRDVCRRHNIPCDDWYVTNVLKTVHPDDGNGWSKSWQDEWLAVLARELAIVRPKFLLCLGAEVIKCVLGSRESLKGCEGRVYEVDYPIGVDETGVPVFSSCLAMGVVHPAAILHKPQLAGQLTRDLVRFDQLTRGIRWDQDETGLDHRVVLDMSGLLDLEEEIESSCEDNLVAIDAEWQGERPNNAGCGLVSVQLSWKHKTAACIGLRTVGGVQRFSGGTIREALLVVARILGGRQLAGHFVVADLEWLDAEAGGTTFSSLFRVPETHEEFRTAVLGGGAAGFDTAYAMHAIDESAEMSLKSMAISLTDAPRYDVKLKEWLVAEKARRSNVAASRRRAIKKELTRLAKAAERGEPVENLAESAKIAEETEDKRLSLSEEEEDVGFGAIPDEIRDPYANMDADVTRRIAVKLKTMLDRDQFGQSCWKPFWITMRALPAILEINRSGLKISRDRMDRLVVLYIAKQRELLKALRALLKWDGDSPFNPDSAFEAREAIFGEKFNGKTDKENPDRVVRLRPEGAVSLYLPPVLSTGKRAMLWGDVTAKGLEREKTPSVGRMALAILSHKPISVRRRAGRIVKVDCSKPLELFRSYKVVAQILRSCLRRPLADKDGNFLRARDGSLVYPRSSRNLPGGICDDGKVRTHIYPTKETGRWSSSRVPLHNISKRREADYQRILGDVYPFPLRSILQASPGHMLVEADYIGAELFGMAVMACDEAMIRDATRNQLPEHDPNFYDIHSNIAVQAFRLPCEPTKAGLDSIGKKHLRDIAKSVIFGIAYGRQAKAIAVAAREQGVMISEEEAEQVRLAIFSRYPGLEAFFEECRRRASRERFIVGCLGRMRRAPATNDPKLIADYEREFMNFPKHLGNQNRVNSGETKIELRHTCL